MVSNGSVDVLLPLDDNAVFPVEVCEKLNGSVLNVTCLEHAPELTSEAITRAVVLFVMAVFSFVGNALTIASIRKTYKRRRSHTVYTLILHLSVADLLVTLFCIFGEAIWTYTIAWFAGNAGCKLFKFAQMLTLYLSTFILVHIGVDRFVAVRYPIKAISTAKKTTHIVAAVYLLSAVLSVPQVNFFRSGYLTRR